MKDVLIIGAGPVGLYAWSCAGMLGLTGYIIEGNDSFGGQPMELYPEKDLYDIPGTIKIPAKKFLDNLLKQAQENGKNIELLLKTNILHLKESSDGFRITLTSNQILTVKAILITTGNGVFTPIRLEQIKDKTFTNLWYSVNESSTLTQKKVIIFGGGDSAVDWANHLVEHQITNDVTIVHRRELYRAKENNVQKLQKNNILEIKPANIIKIDYNNDLIKSITVENTITKKMIKLTADYFIVQFGAKISPTVIEQWNVEFNKMRKIITNPNGSTSHPKIFAAGNVADYPGKYYNMTTGFGEAMNALYNITKVIHGEKYHPGYLSNIKK